MLRELHRERLYEAVAQEIKRYVAQAGLQPGDSLPSERELCEQLGVGRTSLREALRLLQMMGLIEIKVGRGSFVRQDSLDSFLARAAPPLITAISDIRDLAETRELLEVKAISLAAERRTEQHLEALRARLLRDREQLADGSYAVDDDLDFHRLVFEASGNKVLQRFVSIISEVMRSMRGRVQVRGAWQLPTLLEHEALYEALRARDVQTAVQRMRAHVRSTEAAILLQERNTSAAHAGAPAASEPGDRQEGEL